MLDAFFVDLNYLASDLVTGKSLPILVAASVIPLDPNLLGTMIMAGVSLGCVVNLARAWRPLPAHPVTNWAVRFANHLFSVFLSASFALRVARILHPSGVSLSVLPMFCVIVQHTPERPSTPFTLLVLSLTLFWAGIAFEFEAFRPEGPDHVHASQALLRRSLLAFSRQEWQASRQSAGLTGSMAGVSQGVVSRILPEPASQGLWDSLRYSLLIVALSFYATVQHGPIHSYALDSPAPGASPPRKYMSIQFLYSRVYAIWPTVCAGLLRAYVYLRTAWLYAPPPPHAPVR